MSKERLLTILVLLLTVLNLAILGVLFFQKPKGPPPPPRKGTHNNEKHIKQAIEVLGFDEAQAKVYIKSREEHMKQMKSLPPQLVKLSSAYYQLGVSEEDMAKRAQLLQQIEELNMAIYQANTQHFDDLRGVCREDQKENVDRFIEGLLNKLSGPGSRRGPPRKRK